VHYALDLDVLGDYKDRIIKTLGEEFVVIK
jgi:hypothetical protein